MPLLIDMRIRMGIFALWLSKKLSPRTAFAAGLLVPAMVYVIAVSVVAPSDAEIVADIRVAQEREIARGEQGIYHMKRVIREGADKTQYVRAVLGEGVSAPERIDEIETFQHDENALALIRSNATDYTFEAFLARSHDGTLSLHHYGEAAGDVPEGREVYDTAHDLATLYADYTSLEARRVPVLAPEAELVTLDREEGTARFRTTLAPGLTLISVVSLETKLVTEEIIYV